MILTVLICSFVLGGIFGCPGHETPQESIEGRTFDFDWNPLNWFSGESSKDPNDKKLAALYNTIDCLVKKSPKECSKPLDEARLQFENDKNRDKNKSTTTSTTPSSSSSTSTTTPSTTSSNTSSSSSSTTPSTSSTDATTASS